MGVDAPPWLLLFPGQAFFIGMGWLVGVLPPPDSVNLFGTMGCRRLILSTRDLLILSMIGRVFLFVLVFLPPTAWPFSVCVPTGTLFPGCNLGCQHINCV